MRKRRFSNRDSSVSRSPFLRAVKSQNCKNACVAVPISAADGGRVIVAETHRSYGIYVIIQHDDGTKTVYAHMSKRTVSVGDRVYQGQKIGEVGSTGYSTGDHLHFEIIKNGNKVDPEKYLPER